MEKNKTDLRVVKTKKLLYATLIELIKEKSFDEIRVSDICNRALVNRSTFYSHYEDKYELFSEFVKDIKDNLSKELNKTRQFKSLKEYYVGLISIFIDHIVEYKDIYKAIVFNNKNSIAMDIIYDVINDDVKKNLSKMDSKSFSNIPSNIITRFYLGAVFNVGLEFLNDSEKYSKEKILSYFEILIPDKLNS